MHYHGRARSSDLFERVGVLRFRLGLLFDLPSGLESNIKYVRLVSEGWGVSGLGVLDSLTFWV